MAASSKESIENELAELKSCSEQKSLQNVLDENDKELKLLQNTTLHIGVTGYTGTGKSSLVNAFRNMSDTAKDSAKTGPVQTTMEPEKYLYPLFPEITLWDLPGIGTLEFNASEYLKKVNFSRYDFFIIVSSGRFSEHDAVLAKEIQKMNKRFYFVRTKVDQDLNNESRKPNFREEEALRIIRTSCLSNLKTEGFDNPKVFLISRWDLNKYDFPKMHKTLADDLNDLKRPLLIMAMPAFSSEHLQQKKDTMKALIWRKALKSCAMGAVFVPGLSSAYDIYLLVSTMKEFCKAFGLDDDSLRNLAERVNKPVDVLKSAVQKTRLASEINSQYVWSLITKFAMVTTAMVVEEYVRCIPVLGSVVGGATSFVTTRYMLNSFLEDAMEDAKSILAKATE